MLAALEHSKMFDTFDHEMSNWISRVRNGKIPDKNPFATLGRHISDSCSDQRWAGNTDSLRSVLKSRKAANRRGVWSAVAKDWINDIAGIAMMHGINEAIEICAGAAFLGKGLDEAGIRTSCSDSQTFGWQVEHSRMRCLLPVAKRSSMETVKSTPSRKGIMLVVSWAPNGDESTAEAFSEWGAGNFALIVGDRRMCGTKNLYNIVEPIFELSIPSFPFIDETAIFGCINNSKRKD